MEIAPVRYVAFIHGDSEAGFGVSFPDFPGCVSVGDTRSDAVRRGAEALAFHVEGMIEDGEPIPPPRSVRDVEADPGLADWRQGADFELVPDVTSFVAGLAQTPGESLFSPWFEWDEANDASDCSAEVRRRQLVHYLISRIGRARYLLIAEAAGYQGAHFSGIAMTSERILLGHKAKCGILPCHVLPGLEPTRTSSEQIPGKRRRAVRDLGFTEPTATIVWRTFLELGVDPLKVVLWNAVPWHPYCKKRGPLSNRTPTPYEEDASTEHLKAFLALYPEAHPVSIGDVSERLLSAHGDFPHATHPARGRVQQFAADLKSALARCAKPSAV